MLLPVLRPLAMCLETSLLETTKPLHTNVYRGSGCYIELAATYSPTLAGSTISAERLNFSVRNGKRWALSL